MVRDAASRDQRRGKQGGIVVVDDQTKKQMWDEIHRLSQEMFNQLLQNEKKSEDYWNSLSKEQQLDVFCAVVRRIHQATLVDQGTYEDTLYKTFGFGPESHTAGMDCGYLDLHSCIYSTDAQILEAAARIRDGLLEDDSKDDSKE